MEAPISMVPITSVLYRDDERIRQDLDLDGIRELSESIALVGLLNPIIIRKDYKLLAGRRRLAALALLERTEVPVRFWEDLDEISQLVIELDENRKRKQLTWVEEVGALRRLHMLKSKESLHWTLGETAAMVGISVSKLSEDLMLAGMAENERVKARPTRSGALKTAKRERELEIVRELARRRSDALAPSTGLPHESVAGGTLYHGDCRELLSSLRDNSVDMIFTDPPGASTSTRQANGPRAGPQPTTTPGEPSRPSSRTLFHIGTVSSRKAATSTPSSERPTMVGGSRP